MKKSPLCLFTVAVLLAWPASNLQAAKSFREKLVEALTTCEYAFDVVVTKSDKPIPPEILRQAKGIVIVHQYRVGLIIGGQAGSAVLVARNPQTGSWGSPVFLDPGGVNFGLQAGAKEINSVLLLMTDEAVRRAYTGRFEVGADAGAVAGPSSAEVENFDLLKAKVLVYTSSGGLYAGASIKTGWLTPYEKANRELYNTSHSTPEIAMSTWFKTPAEAQPLVNKIVAIERGGS